MKFPPIFLLLAMGLPGVSLAQSEPPKTPAAGEQWRPLLDGKLSGWEIWMGAPRPSVTGLPAMAPDIPLGLGNDPKHVFTARMESGEPVLFVTGEIFGGLTTLESFSNYHFRTEFKWGERKWDPKLNAPRDSGIMFHCTGPHGAEGAWKRSIQVQVQEKDTGDLIFVAATDGKVTAAKGAKSWHFDPAAQVQTAGAVPGSVGKKVSHLPGDFEKPKGEWNRLDLYTLGRAAVFAVNGKVVQAVRDLANVNGTQEVPLAGGQLQIQSEGAEIYFRRMEICSMADFPPEIKQGAGWR